jgi:hypothetical protein
MLLACLAIFTLVFIRSLNCLTNKSVELFSTSCSSKTSCFSSDLSIKKAAQTPAIKQIEDMSNDNFTLKEFIPKRDGGRLYSTSQP